MKGASRQPRRVSRPTLVMTSTGLALLLAVVSHARLVPGAEATRGPVVSGLVVLTAAPQQRTLLEIRFDVTTLASLPYYPYASTDDGYGHPDGITVDVSIVDPAGVSTRVPAFYFVPYLREDAANGTEVLGISGPAEWRVRYAPRLPGTHDVIVEAVDRSGRSYTAPLQISVAPASVKGFVRTDPQDPRFLAYENGEAFLPIAEGRQWPPDRSRPIASYVEALASDGRQGVTLTRVWDQNDSFGIALEGSAPVWEPAWSQFSRAVSMALDGARSGRRAARFRAAEGPPQTDGYVQRVAVDAGRRYELRGFVRTERLAGGGAFLSVRAASSFEPGAQRSTVVTGTHGWTELQLTFTTADAERSIAVWAGAARSTGTAWFDDLSLVALPDGANALDDPGFERHFPRGDRGNDPDEPAVAKTVPKGTFINQRDAFELDAILRAAEAAGIAVQLCSRGDAYWTWDATVTREPSARENGYAVEWGDPRHLGYWKRNYRYRVARWAYSPALLAWEVWNEHGHIEPGSKVFEFYRALAPFVRDLDWAGHLITTSQGSQAYSPTFWATGPLDLVNYHDYITTALARHPAPVASDAALFVYSLASDLVARWPEGHLRKPTIWGEIGTLARWNEPDDSLSTGAGGALTRHHFLWAGMFSPLFTSPIDWQAAPKAATTSAIGAFFDAEPLGSAGWQTFATADLGGDPSRIIATSTELLRVMAMKNAASTRLLAWLQHRQRTWGDVIRDGRTPRPVTGGFETPAMEAGHYRLEWWSTTTGVAERRDLVDHPGGPLRIDLPEPLSADIALKIVAAN